MLRKLKVENCLLLLLLSVMVLVFLESRARTLTSRTQLYNSYIKLCLGFKGRNEADPAFLLATRPGKMGVSFPLGISRFILQEKILFPLLI